LLLLLLLLLLDPGAVQWAAQLYTPAMTDLKTTYQNGHHMHHDCCAVAQTRNFGKASCPSSRL
jgi:hypothetical protein